MPLVPGASAEEVIVNRFGAITMVIADDLVCTGLPLSLTATVKFDVPLAVGVPEMTPVVAVRVNPAGRPPDVIDHE